MRRADGRTADRAARTAGTSLARPVILFRRMRHCINIRPGPAPTAWKWKQSIRPLGRPARLDRPLITGRNEWPRSFRNGRLNERYIPRRNTAVDNWNRFPALIFAIFLQQKKSRSTAICRRFFLLRKTKLGQSCCKIGPNYYWKSKPSFRVSLCLLPISRGSVVYNCAFRMLVYAVRPRFWRYLRHFGQIWKVISPLISANFSTSKMMDEINFWNPNFFSGLEFPICASWYLVGWDRQKAHLRSVHFPLVSRIPEILLFFALASA